MERNSNLGLKFNEKLNNCVDTINLLSQHNKTKVIKTIETIDNYLRMIDIEFDVWIDVLFDVNEFVYTHMSYSDEGINNDLGYPPNIGWRIGYTKIGSNYRLAAKQVIVYDEQFEERNFDDPILLIDAPYSVRIEAMEHLEPLILEITYVAKTYIKMIEEVSAL